MLHFSYSGRDPEGKIVRGRIMAPSAEEAAQDLSERNIIPVKIVLKKNPGPGFTQIIKKIFTRNLCETNDLIIFCQQMHTFYKAGIPIVTALKNIGESNTNKYLAKVITLIIVDIEAGYSLATAMAKHPAIFPSILVNIVQVGEVSGQLEEAMQQVSEYLEMQDNTVKQIKSAGRYPMLVISFIFAALIILNIFVIPVFEKVFAGYQAQLPMMTRILLGTSKFMIDYWYILFASLLFFVIALMYLINTPRGRYIWDGLKLKVPVFGMIIQQVLFARLARCFALILRTNILLAKGIELTAEAADNVYVREHLLSARSGLSHGESILNVVRKT